MKKLMILTILFLILLSPVPVYAASLTVTPVITPDVTPAVTPTVTTQPEEQPETYTIQLTEEEKTILLDSIQTIRAILVFIVFVIVIAAIIKFLSWFF